MGVSQLALEWFSLVRSSPALLNASISFAAAHIDSRDSTRFFTHNPEIIAHKLEAIQQINLELSGNDIPDAIIHAIMSMAREPEESSTERQERIRLNNSSPFNLPLMPAEWQENFTLLSLENTHFEGAQAIVHLKGGIGGIRSQCTAKAFSQ
jgi:hypothetical protein